MAVKGMRKIDAGSNRNSSGSVLGVSKPTYKPITMPNKGKASSSIAGGKRGRGETMGPIGQAASLAKRQHGELG